MNHVFIINPLAGPSNQVDKTKAAIAALIDIEPIVYVTKSKKDASDYVRKFCVEHPNEKTRFYACGGDGTINEVLVGLIGQDKTIFSMTCYPVGTGNDYVKIFGGEKKFLDLANLVSNGIEKEVDVMEINNGQTYSINVVNYGFDSNVVKVMETIKRNKKTSNEKAYMKSVLESVIHYRKNEGETFVDGKKMGKGDYFCFGTIANGQYIGGQFKTAPRSICDDGEMDCLICEPISALTLLSLLNKYKKGKHLDSKRLMKKYLSYCQSHGKVEIFGPDDFCISVDGELIFGSHFEITNIQKAITFVYPK